MLSSLACSSFTSKTCSTQEQGCTFRKLKPLKQIKGLNLRFPEPKGRAYNIPKSSSKISASLPHNLGKIDEPLSSNTDSLSKCYYSATAEHGDAFVQESSISSWTKISKQLHALYNFTRPYTICATAVVPMVLINIYMAGINQLTDIGVDKINKPTLPLASGEFSFAAGTTVVALSVILSFAMGVMFKSLPLLCAITAVFFIGTVYSVKLPLLRWKENAYLAGLSIIVVRALAIPLGIFSYVQTSVLGRPLVFTKPVIFAVAFMSIIATLIAVIKDIPDVEGDKAFGFQSPSIVFGKERVFWSSVYILMATYAGAAVVGATSSLLPNKIITVLGHGILASILWIRANSVNISAPPETLAFYLFVWK
ncbi:hypothetical protein IFM89_024821, partial [Coptis chinensis]